MISRANDLRKTELETLLADIKDWRAQSAKELSMAPAAVMPEHVVFKVATHTARYGLDKSLDELGVRISTADKLADILKMWRAKNFQEATDDKEDSVKIMFP